MSDEERYYMSILNNKQKVVDSPSEPPVNYSFRQVDKKKWVSKKGFKVC